MANSSGGSQPQTSLSSRVQRFHMRAEECWQLSEMAEFADTKRIYRNLALSYEQLARHAEAIDDHKATFRRLVKGD